jgi:hypothetical protein
MCTLSLVYHKKKSVNIFYLLLLANPCMGFIPKCIVFQKCGAFLERKGKGTKYILFYFRTFREVDKSQPRKKNKQRFYSLPCRNSQLLPQIHSSLGPEK